jgi:hypothetical protein
VGYLIVQNIRGSTISVQIEPRPFGFRGELPVPDSATGRAFLVALEEAWQGSLRRRFLVHDSVPSELRLQRINWLQFMGVLTREEAAAERSLIDSEAASEPKMIGFALN